MQNLAQNIFDENFFVGASMFAFPTFVVYIIVLLNLKIVLFFKS